MAEKEVTVTFTMKRGKEDLVSHHSHIPGLFQSDGTHRGWNLSVDSVLAELRFSLLDPAEKHTYYPDICSANCDLCGKPETDPLHG